MKRAAIAILLGGILLASSGIAEAQVPTIGVYFDKELTRTSLHCMGTGFVDTLYVGGKNFGTWVSTVEFRVTFGGATMIPMGEFMVNDALSLGTGFGVGITITWPQPRAGFNDFIIEKIAVMWMCDACGAGKWDDGVTVLPHAGTGQIAAIEWQTFKVLAASGAGSIACGLVPTKETSWSKVKALYQ
jgi:hypothetical protein